MPDRRIPIVMVLWRDACAHSELRADDRDMGGILQTSVGLLIHKNKTHLFLAQTISGVHVPTDIVTIPRSIVKKIARISSWKGAVSLPW